jgi:dTDP-4-dehydrorhamnose reductase
MSAQILIIGANGQLGTDLRRVFADKCTGVDWPEFDVQRQNQVRDFLREQRPEVVINCAALTNVDQCEDESGPAFAVNAIGAMNVARAAEEIGGTVVYISTDYVFGGDTSRKAPYTEDDPPAPLNVYGTSKLAGEFLTRAYNTRTRIVRTCGLYGHAGARGKGGNFVETMLRLAKGAQPVRVVDDQRLSPASTAECATKVKALVECGARGLYHVASSDSCTWFEFAQAIFEYQGLTVSLSPISSAEYPVRARRPAFSALTSQRLAQANVPPCRPWREMLREYLQARQLSPFAGVR